MGAQGPRMAGTDQIVPTCQLKHADWPCMMSLRGEAEEELEHADLSL